MNRLTVPAVAILLVAALSLPLPAAARQQKDEQTIERSLDVQPGSTLRLKTFSGRVHISGTAGNRVVIKAVRRATPERLRDITLEITQRGNTVEIDANHRRVERRNDNVVETDLDIQVPTQVTLDINSFSAPITVTGVLGSHRLKTFSANIELASSTWADGSSLDINTFSGDVALRLPATARGTINFDSFSGHFDSALPVTLTSNSRRKFRGDLNGGGAGDFNLKTFSGDVRIGR